MLVLTRKLEQSIQIGDDVTITILAVKGNTVRIGISAPEHVRVARSELNQKGAAPKGADPKGADLTVSVGEPSSEGSPAVASMEVIEIQSRPDAPIKFDRLRPVAMDTGRPRSTLAESLPPLHSRLPMFSDSKFESHQVTPRSESR